MVDTTAIWASFITGLPAIIASLVTLGGVLYTTYKLREGQTRAAEKALITATEVKAALSTEASKVKGKSV